MLYNNPTETPAWVITEAQTHRAKRHTESVQHSSKFPDWRTPPRLFAVLDQEFCFVLDAAAEKINKLCPHYFGPDHHNPALRDGLAVNWREYLHTQYEIPNALHHQIAVFVNPSYSRELANAYRTGQIKVGNDWVPHEVDPQKARGYEIGPWVEKAYEESLRGVTVVGVIPYSPQTEWWRRWVEGHNGGDWTTFHAARETRKIPHRVTFLRPDGTIEGNAGGNTSVVVWRPRNGMVAPWVPWAPYWDYEDFGAEGGSDGEANEG